MKNRKENEMDKYFWKATAVRCARTFLTTILGVWTAGTLIIDVDWKTTILSAVSATVYIFIVCIVGGLPEVKKERHLYQYYDEPEDSEVIDDEE